jgi:hypothetical protein
MILPVSEEHEDIEATLRPTEPQRRYLARGLTEPGGKLPLFDRDGREVAPRTIQACLAHGWAVPWFANPVKPDWLVCRLTPKGYSVLGQAVPGEPPGEVPAAVASGPPAKRPAAKKTRFKEEPGKEEEDPVRTK